jgi:hypothetical protein
MGLLFSHSKTNRSILTTEQRRYKDYIIDIELIEYDLNERFLFLRHTERKVGINFRAFDCDTEVCEYTDRDGEHRQPISVDCAASETFAWPKERGQDDWPLQIRGGLQSLIEQLEDDSIEEETPLDHFNDALDECDLP